MKELEAPVTLVGTPYLGSIKIRLLLERFGSAIETLQADPADVQELPGFDSRVMHHWGKWLDPSKNLELAKRMGVEIIPFTSPKYPKRLLEIADHPIVLYVKGEIGESDLAVVGTRQASIYGREMAENISEELTAAGWTVVSGLARGIDTAAHRGALKRGRTIAVIGSGLANVYPRENQQLSEEIAENGALISEFPMETPPDRQNFPQRNRIVSGMTRGTLLIEAPERSGAMITMRKALSQGRTLFALPGRVDQENFKGNHLLLKSGQAQYIENANDILHAFNDLFTAKPAMPPYAPPPLEEEEARLLQQLPGEELNIDEIVTLTKLPIMKLNVLLMSLVLKKVIKEYPGKVYKKAFCSPLSPTAGSGSRR